MIVWTEEAKRTLVARTREALGPSARKPRRDVLAKLEAIVDAPPRAALDTTFTEDLRVPMLAAPGDVRETGKKIARAAWGKASVGQKTTIAWTFFEESAWTNAAALEWAKPEVTRAPPIELFYATVTDLDVLRRVWEKRNSSRSYYELLVTFGEGAVAFIADAFEAPRDELDQWHAARALALVDSPRAAHCLASALGKVRVRPSAAEHFARFPMHAERELAPLAAAGKGRVAKFARELLERARRATDNVRGPSVEEASDAELPPILANPPWLAKKRVPAPTFALKIAPIEREERVVLDPERARAALERRAAKLPTVPEEELLELFNGGERNSDIATAYVIARFGALAMSGIVHCAKWQSARDDPRWVLTGDSTRVAIAMLERADDELPRLWFRRYPETTLHALLPIALSGDHARSERALRAISMLAREGHAELAHRVAQRYGKNVDEALDVWLAWDSRWDLPAKVPKMPSAWNPAGLRRPTLRNGKALPLAAVGHIGTMLAMSTRAAPYVGLLDVKEACDPHSLAEFAWDCACAWEMSSSLSQRKALSTTVAWMRDALVHFGDDEVVRRTTPAMKPTNVVPVLEAIGTPAAVMELLTIEERTPSLKSLVSKALTEIAHQQSLEVDELVESVPIRASVRSVGAVHANGEISVRDGGRTLRIGFDSKLEAYVETEDGVRTYKHKFHEAQTVWNDLREDVSVLAPRLLAGLERAMVSGRTWSMDAFRKRWLEDPVMRHLSGSIIWTQHGRPFRVALDGSFAGSLDEAITLSSDEVGILHPARVTADERERWAALIADYKLVQPFVQLALRVHVLEGDGDVYVLPIPKRPRNEVIERLTNAGFARSLKIKGLFTRGGTTITLADGDPVSSARVEWRVGVERIPLAKVDPVEASEALAPLSS